MGLFTNKAVDFDAACILLSAARPAAIYRSKHGRYRLVVRLDPHLFIPYLLRQRLRPTVVLLGKEVALDRSEQDFLAPLLAAHKETFNLFPDRYQKSPRSYEEAGDEGFFLRQDEHAPSTFHYREMRTIAGSQAKQKIQAEIVVNSGYLMAENTRCKDFDEALEFIKNNVDCV
jgi:hypothetical protein